MTIYSPNNPSPRYLELVEQYKLLHEQGDATYGKTAEETFPGHMIQVHVPTIAALIEKTGAKTLLDYGSGKGKQYNSDYFTIKYRDESMDLCAYWGLESIQCYDPAYAPYTTRPTITFDGVICTDVLEHCPEEDIDWILNDIFSFAQKFVFANIASYPAKKLLPNGENAHSTVKPVEWWLDKLKVIQARYPGILGKFVFTYEEETPEGIKKKEMIISNEK